MLLVRGLPFGVIVVVVVLLLLGERLFVCVCRSGKAANIRTCIIEVT